MKNGWQTKALGEICSFENGDRGENYPSKSIQTTLGIPFINAGHLTDFGIDYETMNYIPKERFDLLGNGKIRKGDILFCLRGSLGKFASVGELSEGAIASSLVIVRPGESVLNKYIMAYFQSDLSSEMISKFKNGAAQPNLSAGSLKKFVIPLPPLPEQQRIVGLLDKAFEGIATAKANAEKNLQNARALFESHLHSVFSQRGDDWKMVKLDNLTELARGHNPPKSKFSRERKPGYVRFYQIRDGATDDYTVYVPDTPQLHKMNKDDIMLVAYRHVGRAFRGVEGAFNVALCKITNVRRDLLDDDFLFYLIPSQYVKGELLKRSERSLIPSMSIEHLREIEIPLPPIREQKVLIRTIKSLTEQTQRLEFLYQRKLTALDELKKSLLHRAFCGAL